MRRKQLLQRIQTILLRRRDALRRSLSGELGRFHTSEESVVGDPVDAALDTEYAEINSELAESEGLQLARIERALERLREGHYGVCERCGHDIPLARLQALPDATLCIRCQELYEEGRASEQEVGSRPPREDAVDDMEADRSQSFELVE
jgi:DnaK suppressor protein